jgi:hypothetical protein
MGSLFDNVGRFIARLQQPASRPAGVKASERAIAMALALKRKRRDRRFHVCFAPRS